MSVIDPDRREWEAWTVCTYPVRNVVMTTRRPNCADCLDREPGTVPVHRRHLGDAGIVHVLRLGS